MEDKTQTIRVVAAIADKTQVTLYKEDGDTLIIKQGDHRLNDLLDAIIPITTRGEVAVISLTEFSVYAAFQRKSEESGSFVKLFKVARKKLSSFFGSSSEPAKEEHPDAKPLSAATVGALMVAANPATAQAEQEALAAEREDARLTEEVMAMTPEDQQALNESRQDIVDRLSSRPSPDMLTKPGNPNYIPQPAPTPVEPPKQETIHDHLEPIAADDEINEVEETVVAVIGSTVIPNIEKIRPLIDRAMRTNSAQSIENFLKRLATMIDKRRHSVEDVLRFLERGDLPLAEDGSIIAYKMLNWADQKNGVMKDCHSGNVLQKVGSYVCVDESLVDLNRSNECSNGLHIARRAYLSGFSGNVCVLCKIDPEDVVTVPHGDPNKVRVKGYHILALLSDEAKTALRNNQPMTAEKGALRVVYDAIKGNHVARLEEVRVTQQMGRGLKVTPIKQGTKAAIGPAANVTVSEPTQGELAAAAALDDPSALAGTVEPREINKRVNQEIEARSQQHVPEVDLDTDPASEEVEEDEEDQDEDDASAEVPDIDQEVQEAMDQADGNERAASVLEALGVTPADAGTKEEKLVPVAQTPAQEKKLARKEKQKAKRNQKAEATRKAQADRVEAQTNKEVAARPVRQKAPGKPSTPSEKVVASITQPKQGTLTKADEARALFNAGKLQELREFKKRVKKGWGVLGFTDAEVEKICPEVG